MEFTSLTNFTKKQRLELLSWIKCEHDLIMWSGNTFQSDFSVRTFSIHLKRDNLNPFAFLNSKNELIAYGEVVETRKTIATICRVIIRPDSRGHGIGYNFCHELISWIEKKKQFRWISLNTLRHNLAARKCYWKLGFQEMRNRSKVRFRNGNFYELIVMKRKTGRFGTSG